MNIVHGVQPRYTPEGLHPHTTETKHSKVTLLTLKYKNTEQENGNTIDFLRNT